MEPVNQLIIHCSNQKYYGFNQQVLISDFPESINTRV